MLRLRSYAWSVAAGILAVLSCSLISLPFGVWALIVLARPDVRETFAHQHELPPASKRFWPWAVGIALIGVPIVIAMIVINGLITSVALMHHHQTGGTPEETGANPVTTNVVIGNISATNQGSTRGLVMSAPAAVPPPVRIKAGSFESFTDSDGNLWLPDQGFVGGNTVERSPDLAIVNTRDPELYRSERYDMRSFSYPAPNGKYIVKLHFAESNGHIAGPGKRVFTFVVGSQEFKDFDVWTEAGGAQRALIKTVNVEVTDGRLNIYFIRQQEHPEINGIEILPVSPPADAVMPTPPKPTNILASRKNNPPRIPNKSSAISQRRIPSSRTSTRRSRSPPMAGFASSTSVAGLKSPVGIETKSPSKPLNTAKLRKALKPSKLMSLRTWTELPSTRSSRRARPASSGFGPGS